MFQSHRMTHGTIMAADAMCRMRMPAELQRPIAGRCDRPSNRIFCTEATREKPLAAAMPSSHAQQPCPPQAGGTPSLPVLLRTVSSNVRAQRRDKKPGCARHDFFRFSFVRSIVSFSAANEVEEPSPEMAGKYLEDAHCAAHVKSVSSILAALCQTLRIDMIRTTKIEVTVKETERKRERKCIVC